MSFSDRLQRKIEERREGRSTFADAAAEEQARVRTRAAPLVEAVTVLVERLAEDPLFGNGVGRPQPTVSMPDYPGGSIGVGFSGRVGSFYFMLLDSGKLVFEILPELQLRRVLTCGSSSYTGVRPVSGRMRQLDEFIEKAEDRIAEFLADVHASSAAHLLEPEDRRVT